ncbi:hypothetical protein [Actinomadura rupiterrae]|uniref:hypothetical protein n=1 Tax=Actinomadura rupiterrae TaxID=559627 RepID=UPI0020A5BC33|nr:hypothetical protein [Actinomadura rupiterrae]MCP2342667.1 hypothetical protein [Actinomadura rupiterrae]
MRKVWKAGTVGLAGTAAALTLGAAPAPAHAATRAAVPAVKAAPSPTVHAQGRWHTWPGGHDSHSPIKNWKTRSYYRYRGVRVIQVNARCWGNDSTMHVFLMYGRNKVAKSGRWACDGRYRTVRIHNAGASHYHAYFALDRKHTIEYWMQYYQ